MFALVVEADQLVDGSFLDMLLELLNRALAAKAMLTLEFNGAKLTVRNGLVLGHELHCVAYFAPRGLLLVWCFNLR